jgi:cation:H+ antiporter
MTINLTLFIIGLLTLYYSAGWLVKGSSSFAKHIGMQPVVIGLTVVAFGTSAPELMVSLVSSIKGKSMIAVGNMIGSNICNIALVLGMTAIFQPIKSHPSVIKRDIPIMIGISFYLLVISFNGTIGRYEGLSLICGIVLYIFYNYRISSRNSCREDSAVTCDIKDITTIASPSKQVLSIVVGIAGVVLGADLLIDSAVKIMEIFGVSEKFIGLTVVAFGTSLPELATSVVAAIRKELDISIGNIIGSNVFNILAVLGAAALANPISIPGGLVKSGLVIDYAVMTATSVLPLIMMRRTYALSRKNGIVLVLCYVGYIVYLVLKSI